MDHLFTIGYERSSLENFIQTLIDAGVEVLLDIREAPISRRRGFSKSSLREALARSGIQYHHERRLGSPKPLRDQVKSDRDYGTFFTGFKQHLAGQTDVMAEIVDTFNGHSVALMCYERNPRECHRLAVAEALARDYDVPLATHLVVDQDARSDTPA